MKNNTSSKAPSQRQLRVSEEIRHLIGQMFMQNDVFVKGLNLSFLMVTKASISPDLSYATIYVQSMNDVDLDEQLKLLNTHKGLFRYQVGKRIRLRIVPNLIFKSDDSFAHSKFIDDILNSPRVKADIENQDDEEC